MFIGLGIGIPQMAVMGRGPSLEQQILALFTGRQGGWYDPSDFSTLFQDAAGTTPVTALGQSVGLILDKSGNGNHASQSTSASRPVLQQDGTGRYYLDFDGVDDSLVTTFPSALGSNVTIARSIPGVGAQITAGQTVGTTWTDSTDSHAAIIIDRALTVDETAKLTAWLNAKAGLQEWEGIGKAGWQGFGVGVYPDVLPAGFSDIAGNADPSSATYGNYEYSDGSVMVWIPAFWFRVGSVGSPNYATYGANAIDILPASAYDSDEDANADGFGWHRAFIDGGEKQAGVFVDKYQCSNNSGTASSVKNGAPLSSSAAHNPFSDLSGLSVADNTCAGAIAAAKTRGSDFFPSTRFIYAALAILSLAHAQASKNTTVCAWYDSGGTKNFPKGCNNNALGDANDNTIVYSSDGYSNCGLTGSGLPFAKTTHNGQGCGIADLNGNVYEVSLGLTCRTTTLSISGASQENPVELTTTAAHGLSTGDVVLITGITGMTEINGRTYTATVVDTTRVTLDGVDGTGFTAYTSGGALVRGTFHVLKPTVAMSQVTAGTALATDHWGETGVAAQFDSLELAFATTWPNNTLTQRFGNGVTGVLGASPLGNASMLASLGLPAAGAMSPSGTNLFGQDYYYQFIRYDMCALSGMPWGSGSSAGVWAVALNNARNSSYANVGFRAACYTLEAA